MSEFERTRASVPPFVPPVRSDSFAPDAELEAALSAENPFPREGLPPGFRMRHDAHYVDQLTSSRGTAPHVRLLPLGDIDTARPIDSREIEPLVKSIRKHGVLQPLHVRPRAGRFELIAGHRRRAAAAAAGLVEVPCIVHQVDETRARAIADADNLRIADASSLADTGLSDVPASGLAELSQSFSAIGSCLHLLGDRDTALARSRGAGSDPDRSASRGAAGAMPARAAAGPAARRRRRSRSPRSSITLSKGSPRRRACRG